MGSFDPVPLIAGGITIVAAYEGYLLITKTDPIIKPDPIHDFLQDIFSGIYTESPSPSPSPTPGPGPGPAPGPGGYVKTSGIGKDGIANIYPTKSGGFTWYLTSSGFDAHLAKGGGSTFSKLIKNSDGSFTADASKGSARFNLNPPTNYESGGDAIGACKMNFVDSIKRGYTWKASDLRHVEFTGFFMVKSPTTNGGIYMRGPCNHHPSQADCCENANYDVEVSTGNNSAAVFTKQAPKTYTPDPAGPKVIKPNVKLEGHGWFGLKYIHSIISSTPSDPKVLLQAFINLDGKGKNWQKIGQVIDHKGYGWGHEGTKCGGTADQVLAFGSPRMVFKWYTGNVDFKLMSLREINQVPAAGSNLAVYETFNQNYGRITVA